GDSGDLDSAVSVDSGETGTPPDSGSLETGEVSTDDTSEEPTDTFEDTAGETSEDSGAPWSPPVDTSPVEISKESACSGCGVVGPPGVFGGLWLGLIVLFRRRQAWHQETSHVGPA
ncbi:MAG: hypothetical protein QGG40_12060, partial [Myxococcota bacterium]|nr:hypothetical protein [Myxococcota bacterium]